ncbi:MAG: hypothetical protein ABH836_08405 [Candidatus Omnitrophota bacterium]
MMFGKYKKIAVLITVALCSFSLKAVFAEPKELNFIPYNADALFCINNNPDDPGVSFVTGLWQERFEVKVTPEKMQAIDRFYAELPFGKIIGAAFLPEKPFNEDKEPIYPEYIVVVEMKGDKEVFRQALNTLITKRKPLKNTPYMGYDIVYRDKKLEPFHGEKDLAAYVEVGDFFIIGMTPEQLGMIIDTYNGKIKTMTENENFLKLYDNSKEADAFIFLNNENGKFSVNLQRWEEKEGMRLLLSSGLIDSTGLFFDLETDDAVKGKVIFIPKEGEEILTIEDDALFFAEVITRSFAKEGIKWISDVDSSGDFVKLEFEGVGFRPIWEKAMLKKKIVFLEEEQKPEENIQQSAEIDGGKQVNSMPKIIFVGIITVFILSVFLWIKRK